MALRPAMRARCGMRELTVEPAAPSKASELYLIKSKEKLQTPMLALCQHGVAIQEALGERHCEGELVT